MDPVKYIFEKPTLTGRIARWQVLLSEFDIVYVTQKAIKGSVLADYLAQQPLNDYQPMHPEFPDEDIMALFEEKLDENRDKWTVKCVKLTVDNPNSSSTICFRDVRIGLFSAKIPNGVLFTNYLLKWVCFEIIYLVGLFFYYKASPRRARSP